MKQAQKPIVENSPERILIVKLGALGDVILAKIHTSGGVPAQRPVAKANQANSD